MPPSVYYVKQWYSKMKAQHPDEELQFTPAQLLALVAPFHTIFPLTLRKLGVDIMNAEIPVTKSRRRTGMLYTIQF